MPATTAPGSVRNPASLAGRVTGSSGGAGDDPRPPGPESANAGLRLAALAGGLVLRLGRGEGGRLDQVVHLAAEDVQQRHEDLEVEPLGLIDDQPVDLTVGQADTTFGQPGAQVGGLEQAAGGHDLPQLPGVVQLGGHRLTSSPVVNAVFRALRIMVFMKSPLTPV